MYFIISKILLILLQQPIPNVLSFVSQVPQQYNLLGYKAHTAQLSVSAHASRDISRPLRTGAEVV